MKNLSKIVGAAVLAFSLIVNVDARFGQEHKEDALLDELKGLAPAGDISAFVGDTTGAYIRALLAKAPACSVQDVSDNFVDVASIIGKDNKATEKRFIEISKVLITAEKNTPNDGQPSALCDRKPRNPELNGLSAKQDPSPNPKNLPPFVPESFSDVAIPTLSINGKVVVPAKSNKGKKEDPNSIDSLLKKIDNSQLDDQEKKTVKKCTKPKSKDRKKCVSQLKQIAKDHPKK